MNDVDLFGYEINDKIKEEIESLNAELKIYNEAYHNQEPLISDEDYDCLFRKLQKLELQYPQYKPHISITTDIVGAKPNNDYNEAIEIYKTIKQIEHSTPMLSLNNIFFNNDISKEPHHELIQFEKRIKNNLGIDNDITYIASPKFDGIAMSLIYTHGVFDVAVTRGDGYTGENVTHNIKYIKNIPSRLNINGNKDIKSLEIRGEALICHDDFKLLNNKLRSLNKKEFSSPRNASAGIMRQLDKKENQIDQPLTFFAYALIDKEQNMIFKEFYEQLSFLNSLGFNIGREYCKKVNNLQEMIGYYDYINKTINKINFDIDGIVFKVNNIELQQQLGFVSRAPRFAIAYKFSSNTVTSKILDIVFQVGRTGVITPVAKIEAVNIDGVNITRVSLHNQREIERNDIRIYDTVIVKRAGNVIPEIVKVLVDQRNNNISQPIIFPTICPVCSSKLIQEDNGIIVRCSSPLYCSAQIKNSIVHFASRSAMNINGLGKSIVDLLVDNNCIKSVADLYFLTENSLKGLPRFASKSINNLLDAINNSKNAKLDRVIYALGIRNVGESTAKDLAKHFKNINNLISANIYELLAIKDIGEVVAKFIINFFNEEHNINIINTLLNVGVLNNNFDYSEQKKFSMNENIFGKTFVITGIFDNYERSRIKEIIEESGGNVASNISLKTNILIAGMNPGSKLIKAKSLGITVINENQLNQLLSI